MTTPYPYAAPTTFEELLLQNEYFDGEPHLIEAARAAWDAEHSVPVEPEAEPLPVCANGEYTITSPKSHRTFRVKTARNGGLKGKQILALLTGPDNTSEYQGFAFVSHEGRVQVWGRYRGVGNWEKLARAFEALAIRGQNIEGYEVLLSKHCYICNRLLTNPVSIESGIGPECAGRR